MANQYGQLAAAQPQLGYGNQNEASIDTVNQWMRAQPWYQDQLRAWGVDPTNVHLTDAQKTGLVRLAQAHGVVVDEGHNGQEIDDAGNFRPKSGSTLKKVLIGAGIGAAALTGLGAAGIGPLSGFLGGGGAAAGAGGVGLGETASTVGLASGAGLPGAVAAPALAGGAGVAGAAVPAAIGAGASKGIASWLSPILSTAIPVAGGLVGAGIQASANKDAAALQAKGLADALDFEKQQYADLTKRLEPYVASGGSASDRMAQLLGLPARTGTTATAPPTRGPNVGAYQAPAASTQTVMLRAPDGSTKAVPASELDHWLARGAQQVA